MLAFVNTVGAVMRTDGGRWTVRRLVKMILTMTRLWRVSLGNAACVQASHGSGS